MSNDWCNRTWTIQGGKWGTDGDAGLTLGVKFSLSPIYSPKGLIGVYAEFDQLNGPTGWEWCVLGLRKGKEGYVVPKKLPEWPTFKQDYEDQLAKWLEEWKKDADGGPDAMTGVLCLWEEKKKTKVYDYIQLYSLPNARTDTKTVLVAVVSSIKAAGGSRNVDPLLMQNGTAHGDD